MPPRIREFTIDDSAAVQGAAALLVSAFSHFSVHPWPTPKSGAEEVGDLLNQNAYIAFGAWINDRMVGWVGGMRHSPFGWELHPLAVSPDVQGQGIGSLLADTLITHAESQGAQMMWLGADDVDGGTSAASDDLWGDPGRALQRLKTVAGSRHPLPFYIRMGFKPVGFLPDLNGRGRPDILFARRLGGTPADTEHP